jgi:hypothetical protein
MHFPAGSLSGYDQLLSVSVEAINAQLECLWNLNPTPELADGPEHLINHEIKLSHPSDPNQKVNGYIGSPELEFVDRNKRDIDRRPFVFVKFPFFSLADAGLGRKKGKVANSTWTYRREDGSYADININGWQMSWETSIVSRRVRNVQKGDSSQMSAALPLMRWTNQECRPP